MTNYLFSVFGRQCKSIKTVTNRMYFSVLHISLGTDTKQ